MYTIDFIRPHAGHAGGGKLIKRLQAAEFADLLAAAKSAKRPWGCATVAANQDRCDHESDGLTEDERAAIEGVLS